MDSIAAHAAIAIYRVPTFPLAVGFLRTTGRSGLWITLLPAVIGMTGLIPLLALRKALGAWLLIAYSSFWFFTMLSGLPLVWNAKRSFCIKSLNFCIVTPWITRLTVVLLATPFLFAAIWAWQGMSRLGQTPSSA